MQQNITLTINGTTINLSLLALYPSLKSVTSGALIRTFIYKGVNMGILI
jgi:hypothetical protein